MKKMTWKQAREAVEMFKQYGKGVVYIYNDEIKIDSLLSGIPEPIYNNKAQTSYGTIDFITENDFLNKKELAKSIRKTVNDEIDRNSPIEIEL